MRPLLKNSFLVLLFFSWSKFGWAEEHRYTLIVARGVNSCWYQAQSELDWKQLSAEVSKGLALTLEVTSGKGKGFRLLQPIGGIVWVLPVEPGESNTSVQSPSLQNLSYKPCFSVAQTEGLQPNIAPKGSVAFLSRTELETELQHLPQLLTQARAVPYFKDGTAVGLRLFAVRSGSLFQRMGLLNGDILKEIQNQAVTDLSQFINILKSRVETESITLTIERSRELIELTVRIN